MDTTLQDVESTTLNESTNKSYTTANPTDKLDRFVPRVHQLRAKTGGIAEACGVKTNRVFEFNSYTSIKTKQTINSDILSQMSYFQHHPKIPSPIKTRKINLKPIKILDAPGLADEFYSNILHWSSSLNLMAIGLGTCVYAWNPNSMQVSLIADIGDEVSALRWSDDGCISISSVSGKIELYDAEQQIILRSLRGRTSRVASLSWNEFMLSSGGRDGFIWNHDVRIKHHKVSELCGHTGEVCGLEYKEDGRQLASGGNDNVVNVWDARTTSVPQLQLTQHEAAVKALSWCPWQSSVLATGGGSADKKIKIWNISSGLCTETLDAGAQVSALYWNDHYNEIVASLAYPTNSITIWKQEYNLKFLKQVEILNAHESRILHSTMSSDGTTLVTGSADENLKFWNLFETQRKAKLSFPRTMLTMGRV